MMNQSIKARKKWKEVGSKNMNSDKNENKIMSPLSTLQIQKTNNMCTNCLMLELRQAGGQIDR